MEKRFSIKFTKKAYKEYISLDGSIVGEVDVALEYKVGKPPGNKRQINLTGTKEKKLRSSGIRIIYRGCKINCQGGWLIHWVVK